MIRPGIGQGRLVGPRPRLRLRPIHGPRPMPGLVYEGFVLHKQKSQVAVIFGQTWARLHGQA